MIIPIQNETVSAAVSTAGAELTSLRRADGFELLWQGDPAYWAGQAPILFPIVGLLRGQKARIKGQWYSMGRHGFARRREFSVTEQGDDFVSLTLHADEQTKQQYPYDFSLTMTYTCKQNAVETRFTVTNCGEEPMPFVLGGHPAYNIPVTEDERFEEYRIEFDVPETQHCPTIDLDSGLIDFSAVRFSLDEQQTIPLQHSLFYQDALVFENLRSKEVKLIGKNGHGLAMDCSEFPLLGIWSCVNDGPYVALEPWIGCATQTTESDEFAEKKNMILLPAGEQRSFAFTTRYF